MTLWKEDYRTRNQSPSRDQSWTEKNCGRNFRVRIRSRPHHLVRSIANKALGWTQHKNYCLHLIYYTPPALISDMMTLNLTILISDMTTLNLTIFPSRTYQLFLSQLMWPHGRCYLQLLFLTLRIIHISRVAIRRRSRNFFFPSQYVNMSPFHLQLQCIKDTTTVPVEVPNLISRSALQREVQLFFA
jgi:hypothetical protein